MLCTYIYIYMHGRSLSLVRVYMYEYHMDRAVCHVRCEISSVEVTGLACTGDRGALFLRCHVSAGGGRTIQIDSRRHVSVHDNEAASSLTWRDVASLSCDGPSALMAADTRSVVFELRRRHRLGDPPAGPGPGPCGRFGALVVGAGGPRGGAME
ncbi:hypothetical protein BRADI_1g21416v3 [Brachypodium distachyon]|uniref:Uncharacterized protein n=1 Tax=Brachypodium distachyon TaxID=15368 RepID=A0A0Q3GW47_BRADI|nr:hypothetical protein BRADI_1g21416v3 [Brachypodium distachyon]